MENLPLNVDDMLFHNNPSTMNMKIRLFIVHFLLMRVRANVTNDLLMDYFTYKRALNVVGYSCNNVTGTLTYSISYSLT